MSAMTLAEVERANILQRLETLERKLNRQDKNPVGVYNILLENEVIDSIFLYGDETDEEAQESVLVLPHVQEATKKYEITRVWVDHTLRIVKIEAFTTRIMVEYDIYVNGSFVVTTEINDHQYEDDFYQDVTTNVEVVKACEGKTIADIHADYPNHTIYITVIKETVRYFIIQVNGISVLRIPLDTTDDPEDVEIAVLRSHEVRAELAKRDQIFNVHVDVQRQLINIVTD